MRHDYRNLSLISAMIVTALTLNFVNSPRAEAETKTNKFIEQSPFMIEFFNHGPGSEDMTRYYDSDANVVCYVSSGSQGRMSCLKPGNDNLAHKYRTYRESVEQRKALEAQLGNK